MTTETEQSEGLEKHINKFMFLLIGIAVISILAAIYPYWYNFSNSGISNETVDWGQFGDYIGGTLTPALSFISFIALLLTIVLQNKELKLSRIELRRSRQEQTKSATALKEQRMIMEEQLEQMKKTAHAEYYFKVHELLRSKELYDLLVQYDHSGIDNEKFTKWNNSKRENAQKIATMLDFVGVSVRNDLVPLQLILGNYSGLIVEIWNRCEPMLLFQWKDTEEALEGRNFKWLFDKVDEYLRKVIS